MPKLRILSGKEVVDILGTLGFLVAGQKGSHMKLKRTHSNGTKQVLIIPNHQELDKGTLKAVYNQALKYVSEQDLKGHFYL